MSMILYQYYSKTINWFMSVPREVLIRILALLQRKILLETKNRTLKCLRRYYSTVRSMKNVAVLTKDGAFAFFFFVPTPGDLTGQESPTLGICHPRQKNCSAQLELADAIRYNTYRIFFYIPVNFAFNLPHYVTS